MLEIHHKTFPCNTPAGALLHFPDNKLVILRCSKWSCQCCARVRAWKLIKRLGDKTFRYLITITAPAEFGMNVEAVKGFNQSWRRVYQWLKREHPACKHRSASGRTYKHGPFNASLQTYVFSNERGQETGHLHKHIVAQCQRFCYACLRERLCHYGLGAVCDFKRLKSKRGWSTMRAVNYAVKYVTKSCDKWPFPRYSRRVQTSRLNPVEKQPNWLYFKPYLRVKVPEPIMYFNLPAMPYTGDWRDYG